VLVVIVVVGRERLEQLRDAVRKRILLLRPRKTAV
jgi:hypothetical protein